MLKIYLQYIFFHTPVAAPAPVAVERGRPTVGAGGWPSCCCCHWLLPHFVVHFAASHFAAHFVDFVGHFGFQKGVVHSSDQNDDVAAAEGQPR